MRTAQSKFALYFNRLRAMSAPEIAHRASESLKRNAARTINGLDQFQIKDGPAPALRSWRIARPEAPMTPPRRCPAS